MSNLAVVLVISENFLFVKTEKGYAFASFKAENNFFINEVITLAQENNNLWAYPLENLPLSNLEMIQILEELSKI